MFKPLNTGDYFIEVIAWVGLTVFIMMLFLLSRNIIEVFGNLAAK